MPTEGSIGGRTVETIWAERGDYYRPIHEYTTACLQLHQEFKRQRWSDKPSFHDEFHVEAAILAGHYLSEYCLSSDDDFMGLRADLARWNEQTGSNLQAEELPLIFALVFAGHDLGNIAKRVEYRGGKLEVEFLPGYVAKDAEDRSAAFMDETIKLSRVPEDKRKEYLKLAKYLTRQTCYMYDDDDPEGKKPFARFMRVCDQICNVYFDRNDSFLLGLMAEDLATGKNHRDTTNVGLCLNFNHLRGPYFFKEASERRRVEGALNPYRVVRSYDYLEMVAPEMNTEDVELMISHWPELTDEDLAECLAIEN